MSYKLFYPFFWTGLWWGALILIFDTDLRNRMIEKARIELMYFLYLENAQNIGNAFWGQGKFARSAMYNLVTKDYCINTCFVLSLSHNWGFVRYRNAPK